MEAQGLRALESGRAAGAQSQLQSISWHLPFAQPTSNSSSKRQWLLTPPELSQACLFRGAAQQTASLELSAPTRNQQPKDLSSTWPEGGHQQLPL